MKDLQNELTDIFKSYDAIEEASQITISSREDLADYQCNGALTLSKKMKKNPMDIANEIVNKLSENVKSNYDIDVCRPGFINIRVKDHQLFSLAQDNLTVPLSNIKVVIDYSSPNVAKGMHVGHIRSTLIGAALYNMYKFQGNTVIGDNHLGDFGTPLGIVISQVMNQSIDMSQMDINKIEKIYVEGSLKYKEDPSFKEQVLEITKKLQNGEPSIVSIWKELISITKSSLNEDYSKLNISFDEWNGESSFEAIIPMMIKELEEKGLVEDSDGQKVMKMGEGNPSLILTKSNGSYLYHTTDLACLKTRQEYDLSLYVVDKRQSLHFQQVFLAGAKAGYLPQGQAKHISFGTINGSDNKPFKTRSGDVLKLAELIDQVINKSKEKLSDKLNEEELKILAPIIGIGSLKFAELKHNRNNDYIFDLDQFLSLEGFTGPYVMYSSVRANSILNKNIPVLNYLDSFKPTSVERKLLIKMVQFKEVYKISLVNNEPHHLCLYAYELASLFNAFYQENNISKETEVDKKAKLLWIVGKFFQTVKTTMNLLGIDLPEKM